MLYRLVIILSADGAGYDSSKKNVNIKTMKI